MEGKKRIHWFGFLCKKLRLVNFKSQLSDLVYFSGRQFRSSKDRKGKIIKPDTLKNQTHSDEGDWRIRIEKNTAIRKPYNVWSNTLRKHGTS